MNDPHFTIPASAPHTHTVIFLHGRGDNAHNFAAALANSPDSSNRSLPTTFPSFRWVFPQAPVRKCANLPQTWPQWFDVWNVSDFTENEDLQAVGLKEVVPVIRRVLADEAKLLDGRWDRLVLAGFSMGGATGVHVLFNLDVPGSLGSGSGSGSGRRRLAAFMGFACRCPFAGRSGSLAEMRSVLGLDDAPHRDDDDAVVRNTPVLLEHCVDDPVVLVQYGRDLRETLEGFGARVERKEYESGGHWFGSPAGIDDVVDFLNRHVMGI